MNKRSSKIVRDSVRRILQSTFVTIASIASCIARSHEYHFARMYITFLGNQHKIETRAKSELAEAKGDLEQKFITQVRNAKRSILELQSDVGYLRSFVASPNRVIKSLATASITCYLDLIQNWQNLVDIRAFLT